MKLRQLANSGLHKLGYDLVPRPMPDWYLLRAGLLEMFSSLQINCVIDIGANHGQYGDFLRRIGYKDRIFSFEPVSTSFGLLSERIKNDPAWQARKLAVGAESQDLDISITEKDEFSSFLPINSYGRDQFSDQTVVTCTESVAVVRLDSMMNEITSGLDDPRVYLKMDTQGYDLQVLEGASGCLPMILGLQSEIALQPIYSGMPDYLTSIARLNELGFSITSLIPVSRDAGLRVIEFDCLMVRSSRS